MTKPIPRIDQVIAEAPATLRLRWRDQSNPVSVRLDGWIARGGDLLAPLQDPAVFARAAVGAHGAAVTWDDDEGDLAIDAAHLERLAEAQQPFGLGNIER